MSSDHEEDEGPHPVERWDKLIRAICKATSDAFPSSPSFDADRPSTFQTYWRSVMSDLIASAANDDSIPEFISEPPIKNLTIALWDEPDPMCCPCGLAEAGGQVFVEREEGVRKGDVLEAFANFMYGDDQECPDIWTQADNDWGADSDEEDESSKQEEEREEQGTSQRVVVYGADWMRDPGKRNGEEMIHYSPDPMVFIYCCPVDQYIGKKEQQKRDEEKYGGKKANKQNEQQEAQAKL